MLCICSSTELCKGKYHHLWRVSAEHRKMPSTPTSLFFLESPLIESEFIRAAAHCRRAVIWNPSSLDAEFQHQSTLQWPSSYLIYGYTGSCLNFSVFTLIYLSIFTTCCLQRSCSAKKKKKTHCCTTLKSTMQTQVKLDIMEMEYGRLSERLMEEINYRFYLLLRWKRRETVPSVFWPTALFDGGVFILKVFAHCLLVKKKSVWPFRWSWAAPRKWRGRWTCTGATWPSATRRSSSSTSSSGWWRRPPAWPSASGGGCRTSSPTCIRRCCRSVMQNADAAVKSRVAVKASQLILISRWKRYVWRDHQ